MISAIQVVSRLMAFGYDAIDTDLPLVEYAIKKITDDVRNYTNVDGTPESLDCRLIDAVCAEILGMKLALGTLPMLEGVPEKIKSMTQGDVSVTYNASDSLETKLKACIDAMKLRPADLNKFRVMVW